MKRNLTLYFWFVLICMIAVTTWASLDDDIFSGGGRMLQEPWGWATLVDAYFGFLAFYIWILYREAKWLPRALWLVAILLFGNIAMAIYALMVLRRLPANAGLADFIEARR